MMQQLNDVLGSDVDERRLNFSTTSGEWRGVKIYLSIVLVALLVATFFDQQISHFIVNQNSIFGNIFQNYADGGEFIVLFVSFQMIAWFTWFEWQEPVTRGLITALALGFSFNQLFDQFTDAMTYTYSMLGNIAKGIPAGVANNDTATTSLYPQSLQWFLTALTFLFLSWLFFVYVSHKSSQQRRYFFFAALIGILVAKTADTTINDMKDLWGRFRPYEISASGAEFTPWYHLNGVNGHKSFPSGHTMSGFLFLYLTFFVPRENRSWQKGMTIFGLAMGTLTALSRVRIGAHWLSDVSMSALIAGTIIFLASRLLGAHFIEPDKAS